jgi:uncharacterized protein with HEPN domain
MKQQVLLEEQGVDMSKTDYNDISKTPVNPISEYDENMILMVWDSYIKQLQGIQYFTNDNSLPTLFKDDGDGMAPIKSAALLVKVADNALYINQFNHSISICGPVDRSINAAGSAVITANLEEAITQILIWNNNPLNIQKINNHQIIFPYHITGGHWALGILELTLNEVGSLTNAKVNILNPLPDCGGRKMSGTAKDHIQILLRDSFSSSEINLINEDSLYNKQQNDGSSCGAISAENGKDFLDFVQVVDRLNIKYLRGAKDLRHNHVKEIERDDFYHKQLVNQYYNDPNFKNPENYSDLKNEFTLYINSLTQDDKTGLLNIIKLKNDGINTAIKVKEFIKVHNNVSPLILSLFRIDGDDWKFVEDQINTLINIINDWGRNNILGFSSTQSTASKRNNIEAGEIQQNAFNNNDNLEYQYQYHDIRYIGNKIIKEYNKQQILLGQQQIIIVDPLRQGKDLGGIEVNAANQMSKSKNSLDNNHKVVGVFNTGGNHWIAYVLFKHGEQIKCYYKDSLNKPYDDFKKAFIDAFYKDKVFFDELIQPLGNKAEQIIDFEPLVYGDHQHISCGIFALKNMLVLADIDLLHPDNAVFFSPGDSLEEYNKSIIAARKELAEKYLVSRIEETRIEKLRQEIPKIHRIDEPEELKKLIGIEVKNVEVLSLQDNHETYQYRITCNGDQQKIALKLQLKELSIEHTQQDNNDGILLIRADQLKDDNDKIQSLLQIIKENNERLKQKEPQIQLDICKEISEVCRITQKTKTLAIDILKSCNITAIPDTFGTAVLITQSELINRKIQNFENAIKVALNCFDQLGQLKVPENEFIEALYRVSWRSSEIPTKIRFGDSKNLYGTAENANKIGERNWVLLDYLAEALGKYQESSIKNKSFQYFSTDLVILLETIKGEYSSEAYSLPRLYNFVEEYYDQYLLQKIEQTLYEFKDIDANEFIKDSRNCYAILRASEIISESFKNLSETEIQKIQDGEKLQQSLRQFRNALHHESLRTELFVEYNQESLKEFIKIFSTIQSLISKGGVPYNEINYIFSFLEEITSILKQGQLINNQQIGQVLSNIVSDDSKKEVSKYLYRLNTNDDKLDEQKLEILKAALVQDENIFNILWFSQHKLPYQELLKIKNEVKTIPEDILSKVGTWLQAPTPEAREAILKYELVRALPYKLVFSKNEYEEIFKNLLKYKVINLGKLQKNTQFLSQNHEEILGLAQIDPAELDNINSVLDFFKAKLANLYSAVFSLESSKEINKKIYENSISILYFQLLSNPQLIEPLVKELSNFIKNPITLLNKILASESLSTIHELYSDETTERQSFRKALDDCYLKIADKDFEELFLSWFNNYSNILSKDFLEKSKKAIVIDKDKLIEKLNNILSSDDPEHKKITELQRYLHLEGAPSELTEESIIQFKQTDEGQNIIEDDKNKKVDQIIEKLNALSRNQKNFEKLKASILNFLNSFENITDLIDRLKLLEFNDVLPGINEIINTIEARKQGIVVADSKAVDQIIRNKILNKQREDYLNKIKEGLEEIIAESPTDTLYKKFVVLLKKQIDFVEKFKEILAKGLFDIERPFDKDGDRELHFKSLKDNNSICKYFALQEEQTSQQVSIVVSDKKSPLVDRLKRLLNKLEEYVEQIQENPSELHKLSCEFIVERIGDISEKLARSKYFPETEYLSLSKYQLIILNASRKALAHHPLEIGDAKLRYFIEQLVLEARHKIKETIFEGDNVNDALVEHKEITLEFLEDIKCKIRNIVLQHGFGEEFLCYSLGYGCDIGVQGDINFVVIPIDKNTQYTDLFSLELALTKFLQAEVKVFNFKDFKTIQTQKISPQHQDQLGQIEEFATFITTEKFRFIYQTGQWSSAKIEEIEHSKASDISEAEFITASSVDYIYTQHMFDIERRDTEKFRQDRIKNVSEIRKIIEEKVDSYLKNLLHGVNQLKAHLPSDNLELLKLFLIQDKKLDLVIDKYFHSHREEILKAGCVDGIANFRAMIKGALSNNGNFNLIQEEEFFQHAKIWRDLFQKLPIDLKHMVQKLEIFFYEAKNPEIIEQIFNEHYDQAIVQNLLIEDLKQLFCENEAIKCTQFISEAARLIQTFFGMILQPFVVIKEKIDFSSEVEYQYYQTYQQALANIKEQTPCIFDLIQQIIRDEPLVQHIHYDYEVPYISNGILAYSSELKRLDKLFVQIQSNCHSRVALKPSITIDSEYLYEMCISTNKFGTPPEIKSTMRFNSKFKKLQDVLEFYGMTEERQAQIGTKDQDDMNNYYEYRPVYDQLKTYLLRLNKHYLEYEKLKNLANQECNQQIIPLYTERVNQVVQEARFDLEHIKLAFNALFITRYVTERVELTLQNPFKLEPMLQFVNDNYGNVQERETALLSILQLAKQKIQKAIIAEIFKDLEIEERLSDYFIDRLDKKYTLKSIHPQKDSTMLNGVSSQSVVDDLTQLLGTDQSLEFF